MQVPGTQVTVIFYQNYSFNPKSLENKLNDQLTSWLGDAKTDIEGIKTVKSIIGPYNI